MLMIACPSCQRKLRLPDDLAGKPVQCPACQHLFQAESQPAAASPITTNPPRQGPVDIPYAEDLGASRTTIRQSDDFPYQRRRRLDDLDLSEESKGPLRSSRKILVFLVIGIMAFVGMLTLVGWISNNLDQRGRSRNVMSL